MGKIQFFDVGKWGSDLTETACLDGQTGLPMGNGTNLMFWKKRKVYKHEILWVSGL